MSEAPRSEGERNSLEMWAGIDEILREVYQAGDSPSDQPRVEGNAPYSLISQPDQTALVRPQSGGWEVYLYSHSIVDGLRRVVGYLVYLDDQKMGVYRADLPADVESEDMYQSLLGALDMGMMQPNRDDFDQFLKDIFMLQDTVS